MNHPASVLSRLTALATGPALCVAMLLSLTGCASDSATPSPGTDAAAEVPTVPAPPRTLWATDLATSASVELSDAAVLGDIVVIVEEPTNIVTALELEDGSTRYRVALPFKGQDVFTPIRIGDQLVLTSTTRAAVIDANNGALRRAFDLPALIETSPRLSDGLLVATSPTGLVFGIDPDSGLAVWRYQMPAAIATSPAIADNLIVIGDVNGNYSAFFAGRGEVAWRGRTFGRITATPVGSGSAVFIPSEDHSLYALARANGSDRWVYRTTEPITRTPLLAQGKVLQPVEGDKLVALDARNGEVLWQRDQYGTPLTAITNAAVIREDGGVVLVDLADGSTVKTLTYPYTDAVMTAPDDTLVVVQRGGRVFRIEP